MERSSVPPKKKKKRDPQTDSQSAGVRKAGLCKESDDKLASVSSRTYAYIPPESIFKIAESVGLANISEDIATNLAEDVSYKLQEIISASCTVMRQCKRRRLRTSDINAALQVADVPSVFGHSVNSSFNFISVPEAGVFVGEDNEVDVSSVALGSASFTQPKPSSVAISWPIMGSVLKAGRGKHLGKGNEKTYVLNAQHSKIVPVNGEVKQEKTDDLVPHENSLFNDPCNTSHNLYASVSEMIKGSLNSEQNKFTYLNKKASSCSTASHQIYAHENSSVNENQSVSAPASKNELDFKGLLYQNSEEEVRLSSAQLMYFNIISNCLLRGSDIHFQQTIVDLRSNQKLGIVVAPLLNLIAFTAYHVPRHFGILMRLLETVDALLVNPHVNPSFSISVNRLVNALLAISSDQNVILSDDFLLRRKAAHLLVRILAEWNVEEQHVTELLSRVALVLGDSREPIQSQYGALVIFQSLGKPVLQGWVLPLLVKYLPQLEQRSKFSSSSAALQMEEIRGVLLNIVELLNSDNNAISMPIMATSSQYVKAMVQLDKLLYHYIGDAVCARRLPSLHSFRHWKKKRTVIDKATKSCSKGDLRYKPPTSNLFSIHFHGNSSGTTVRQGIQPGVFQDVPSLASPLKKEIHFRFAGANPVPREKLKRRVLDKTHAQFVDHIHGPLHALYQRQFPMVGRTVKSRNKTVRRNSVYHNLLAVL